MRRLLVAIACAIACCAAQAVTNVKVFFAFTPAAVSYLSGIGSTPTAFMATARAAFNTAVSDSLGVGATGFTITEEPNYAVMSCCGGGNALKFAQSSYVLAFNHDYYATDSQVIIDAIGGSAGGISGGTGTVNSASEATGWINIYGGGMSATQAFVHEMGHQFGAQHENLGTTTTAQSFVVKTPTGGADETNCAVVESIMQLIDDPTMTGPGYETGGMNNGQGGTNFHGIGGGPSKTAALACTDLASHCPALSFTDPSTGITHNITCSFNSATTPVAPYYQFSCNLHAVDSYSGPSDTVIGSGGPYPRNFTCPNLTRAMRFSNSAAYITVNGTSYVFGDYYHKAMATMPARSVVVANYHATRLLGPIGAIIRRFGS